MRTGQTWKAASADWGYDPQHFDLDAFNQALASLLEGRLPVAYPVALPVLYWYFVLVPFGAIKRHNPTFPDHTVSQANAMTSPSFAESKTSANPPTARARPE